jgi:hypothetical protein
MDIAVAGTSTAQKAKSRLVKDPAKRILGNVRKYFHKSKATIITPGKNFVLDYHAIRTLEPLEW